MSLAARRRSISERSRRSPMLLKAAASSADSRSGPPLPRAARSRPTSRCAAAATSRSGRVSRSERKNEVAIPTMTDRVPAMIRVALKIRRKARSGCGTWSTSIPPPGTGSSNCSVATFGGPLPAPAMSVPSPAVSSARAPGGGGDGGPPLALGDAERVLDTAAHHAVDNESGHQQDDHDRERQHKRQAQAQRLPLYGS